MRKHLILLCTAVFLSSLHITAQSFRNEIDANPELSASNCLALPRPGATLRFGDETMVMPLPATSTPYYYRWSDFRKFYLDLLNSYREQ